MIPEFNAHGYLPPGIHRATLEDVAARFGRESELRRVQMESLRWMVELAWGAGVLRIVLNGSFVTNIPEPNDVDCVLLIDHTFPSDSASYDGLLAGLPFVTTEIAEIDGFHRFTERFFATDRNFEPKGMIEVTR
ncbi:MAG: hypothetical protein ABI614_22920 [Planctomycetota bacterium]